MLKLFFSKNFSIQMITIICLLYAFLHIVVLSYCWDHVAHVEAVNENFKKVDGSLRIINENFKALDEKVNYNSDQIKKIASETQKSFKEASTYLRHFQDEVNGVKESIRLLNETIMEVKNLMKTSNECTSTTST